MARPQHAEHRPARQRAARGAPTRAPARSWCAGRPDGRPTPADGPRARRRRPPCPPRRRTTGCPADRGQVDAAVAALPIRRRRVEGPHHRRPRPQRPVQPARRRPAPAPPTPGPATRITVTMRIRPAQRIAPSGGQPRPPSWGWPLRWWAKHPWAACKLSTAARMRGLTSRVWHATPSGSSPVCRRSRSRDRVRHRSSRQGPASPDAGRQPTTEGPSQPWLL